jgi:NADH:ubiquinone oxidoreductase subunit 6 (subunit J)
MGDTTTVVRWGGLERLAAAISALVAIVGVVVGVSMSRVTTAAAASPQVGRRALAAQVTPGSSLAAPVVLASVAVLVAGVAAVLISRRHDVAEF